MGGPATSAPATVGDSAERTVATGFAMNARGYGTKVIGGQLPAGSDTTGFMIMGCSNLAGRKAANHEAEVEVPGLGVVQGVRTSLRTVKSGATVASISRHSIARVSIGDPTLGTIDINGLESEAIASHDADGYHATTATSIASITLTPAGADPVALPIPTIDQPLEVPGLVRIELARRITKETPQGARARAVVLNVNVLATGTKAKVGFTETEIGGGVESALFRGASGGVRGEGLDGAVDKGRTPLSLMPCQGTHGEVQEKSVASVNLGDNVVVGAVGSAQMADQTRRSATAWEQGSVAHIDLGNGALVIDGLVGRASLVKKDGQRVKLSSKGTTVGTITANGEPQAFPDTGVLEIPGVARLETVVEKGKRSIAVVALRITLLDGTGAVIDLGVANVGLRPSGL